ncbi:MAG TPA: ABC transporter ATP-binding protein, partial [Pseudonocardiaceae bacterium]|nr:ABC transporter ATP-binding protein [Pseudonocardiaceae bacterium]
PPVPGEVVEAHHTDGQSTFLVRLSDGQPHPVLAEPWTTRPVTLENYVLAQLATTRKDGAA